MRLLVLKQSEIFLIQSCNRVAGCIGHENIQDDVVPSLSCALSIFGRSGNSLTGRLGAGAAVAPTSPEESQPLCFWANESPGWLAG